MYEICFNGKVIYADDGRLLSDVLVESGIIFAHPCGGRGVCGKCAVTVNGKKELSCRYRVESDITVTVCEDDNVACVSGVEERGRISENVCFVLDIGTTTLALALVSLDSNEVVRVITADNPQKAFGADVISRIDYCRKNGVKKLQSVLIDKVNNMTEQFALDKSVSLYVSGNTTMLHIFFGIDCSSIGVAPYTPVFLDSKTVDGSDIGLVCIHNVQSLPCIASFVGADITAGLNYVTFPERGKYSLLIDLGTNAEIALFSKESVLCTSAAAGPCFEGANISYGMSATEGAVCSYNNGVAGTIDNAPAIGICGTGLIDIVAYLLKSGLVDETGYMICEKFTVADNVFVTQEDIRQYQLAKSAVSSAVKTLIEIENITFDDIENVYISGGFSAQINIFNAVSCGLLPEEVSGKCIPINNSSLLGAIKYVCENNSLSDITDKSRYIDLSLNTTFADLFIENMMF